MDSPEWFKTALAEPSQSRFVQLDAHRIHYLTWGEPSRQPLILVHGNGAHAEWWRFIAPLLLPDYFVIALDLGGMGESSHRPDYSREGYVDEVLAVAADAAPGRKPFIVGHSLGGFITIMVVARAGAGLAGAIAVDSPIRLPAWSGGRGFRKNDGFKPTYPDLETGMARFRLIPDQPCDNLFIIDHIARNSLQQRNGSWTWKFDPTPPPDFFSQNYDDTLLAPACSMALAWGSNSAFFPPESVARIRQLLGQRMPLIEIAGAHHHVMLDQPIALVAAIRTQLANWSLPPR
jgi:pimeloyl-ACP methyl ester carboxylesterase